MTTALIKFEAAKRALAEARTIDEVKQIRDKAEALRLYVKQQGDSLEMQNDIAEIKLRAERRAGELLAEMEKAKGNAGTMAGRDSSGGFILKPPEGDAPTLADLGISKSQSHRWQIEASLPEEIFEQYVAETKSDQEELTSAGLYRLAQQEKNDNHTMRVMGSSESPEWYTPKHIIKLVVDLFGEIDLDPCSNSHESPNVPAKKHYTKEDDGLSQPWTGRVYVNPPYGDEIPAWVETLVKKFEDGEIQEAIALLPGRIDTQWFQPLYDYLICNIRGRLQFVGAPHCAPFPSVIVYLGEHDEDFINVFHALGPIVQRIA